MTVVLKYKIYKNFRLIQKYCYFPEILTTLKVNSIDSNKWKRNGAALAFNNLYRLLREEESICNEFFIELLHIFCLNFKLTEGFGNISINSQSNIDLEQVSNSLNHVIRVLNERNYLFNKKDPRRVVPPEFGNGCLSDVILFLFKESSSALMHYRHKCIEMIDILVTKVEGVSSFPAFVNRFISNQMLLEICENEIHSYPNIEEFMKENTSTPHIIIYNWLQYLLSSLDCYCWLLRDTGISKPDLLFNEKRGYKIFEAVTYFLTNISGFEVSEIISKITTEIRAVAGEEDKIIAIKCTIIVRILDFFAAILKSGCQSFVSKNFWISNLAKIETVLSHLIFSPESLDLDFRFDDILSQLPARIESFWKQFSRFYKKEVFYNTLANNFLKHITNSLKTCNDNIEHLICASRIKKEFKNEVSGISFGVKCFKAEITKSSEYKAIFKNSVFEVLLKIFESVVIEMNGKCVNSLPPEGKLFGSSLIEMCFNISEIVDLENDLYDRITNMVLDENELRYLDFDTKITHGQHFFNTFKSCLCKRFDER